jgi:hypothetical protein
MPARLLAPAIVLALAASGAAQTSAPAKRARPQALVVSGSVRGLYPGAVKSLRLKVRNSRGFSIRVVSLRVAVRNASPTCLRNKLRVGRLRRSFVVPAHRMRRVALRVTMLGSAPDACKGAVFPLRFTVRGRRA